MTTTNETKIMNVSEFAQQVANHAQTPVSVYRISGRRYGGFSVQVANTGYIYENDCWTVFFNGTEATASSLGDAWDQLLIQYKIDQDELDRTNRLARGW
jgi:hypothetical protein